MRRALRWILGVVGLLVLGLAAVVVPAFVGLKASAAGPVAPGVALVQDGFVNVFVVDLGPGAVALVDCGQDPEARSIRAALQARGLGPEAVQHVLLTHGHGDHTGGCRAFPGARLHALEGDRPLIEATGGSRGPLTRFMKPDPARARPLTDPLRDGETLELAGVPVRAWAIPGHTPGSAAYLMRGVLFLGDSAGATTEGHLRAAPWLFSDDQAESRASVRRLGAALAAEGGAVTAVAFAHSGWVAGPAAVQELAALP